MLQSREGTVEEVAKLGLEHRVYVPQGGSVGRPLVMLAHGRAGDSSVMWIFSKALERVRPVVIAPQAPLADPKGGWSWWPVHDTLASTHDAAVRAERLREVETGVTAARNFLERAQTELGTDRAQTFVFGFSQGGALGTIMSLLAPELFRGVAILSGFIPFAAREVPGLMHPSVPEKRAKLPAYFVDHGTADPIIPFHRAIDTRDWLTEHGATVTFHQEETTHKTGTAGMRALGEWFDGFFPS